MFKGKTTYKILATLIFSVAFIGNLSAQTKYRYSIDVVNQKNRRIPLPFLINSAKQDFKDAHEWRKGKRIEDKSSRKIRKHTYSIQEREVKKRMKRSKKKAEYNNSGEVPFRIKLKRRING